MIRQLRYFFWCAAALWLPTSGATADLTQFSIEGPSGGRLITLESLVRDGIGYVPLQGLVEQAGGAYNVLPTRLRVDVDSSTAWLRVGESRVHALSIFSLRQPIADDAGAALIALEDVPDFFLKSFRVIVRPVGVAPSTPAPAPSRSLNPPNASVAPETPLERSNEPAALEQLGSAGAAPQTITTLVIDAGHGGYDTGVQSPEKLEEAAVVLSVAKQVKTLLEAGGRLSVILTRPDDKELSLAQRAKVVRSEPGSIFISLHLGSSLSPVAEGVAAFYPAPPSGGGAGPGFLRTDAHLSAESRRLAECLGAAIAQSAGAPLRGVVEAPLKLLSELQVPSAEIELGCLTSSAEAQRLATDEYLARLATGVFNGLSTYLNGDGPASPPVAASAAPTEN
jgi:N-acetylmuramoyl-L-alanine amidase